MTAQRDTPDEKIGVTWWDEPSSCDRCGRQLHTPGVVARTESGEIWCPECVRRYLRRDGPLDPSLLFDLPETRAVVVFAPERVVCGSCDRRIWHSPGFVAITRGGSVRCSGCLGTRDKTVAWLLSAAAALRRHIGFWPGSPPRELPLTDCPERDEMEVMRGQDRIRKYRKDLPGWWWQSPVPDRPVNPRRIARSTESSNRSQKKM